MSIDNLTAYNNEGSSNPLLNSSHREWVKEQDQVNGRVPHSKLVKMQSSTEAMIAFLEDSCFSGTDFTPAWHGEYAIGKFGVQCRTEDSRGQLTIMSNDIRPLLRYLTVNGKDFAGIRPSSGVHGDCPYFEYEEDQGKTMFWLITPDHNQLPYIEITRKEYLQEARAELIGKKNAIISAIESKTPIRSAAVQEAEKKAALEELNHNYSGADLQVRLRLFTNEYRTDEDYLNNSITKATASLVKTIRLMDSLSIHSTAAELGKPAMVSVEAAAFHGFEDNEANRNMLVRINPAYYTATGNDKPLLFLVSWSFDPAGQGANNIDRQVRENIDFRQLKALLVK
jgi:hypothetical protein